MNRRNELRITGAWDYLESKYLQALRQFHDAIQDNPERGRALALSAFRSLQHPYSQYTVDAWLEEYGLVNKVINRAPHKKFNPDGTWESNGVKFGEPT